MDNLKIVDFERYCPKCLHKDLKEHDDPCDDCLNEPVNVDSKKPVNFEEFK